MKKIYTLAIALFATSLTFGQDAAEKELQVQSWRERSQKGCESKGCQRRANHIARRTLHSLREIHFTSIREERHRDFHPQGSIEKNRGQSREEILYREQRLLGFGFEQLRALPPP